MSNLEDLQGRILAAMERIGAGLDGLEPVREAPEPAAPGESVEDLMQALEDERYVSAQLEERVRALHERQDELEAELETARNAPAVLPVDDTAAEVIAALGQMENEINKLRAVNAHLRENNRAMRDVLASGAGVEADLLSASVEAEVEALRADHAAAQAQAEAILAALAPFVAEPETDPETGES
ncbi:hypothetical protein DL237_06075 [Pseudooceanicola sediminis]|uniref:Uncharacterized protein n=1 Tax=Pseudooceanicola sediminis TaxID=2211117 RepID=A0A399J2S1_9RHOB|nr:hypothetical protein [Pseudooceanicola sediminis]KAA2317355.1 hypothetical protein E0K93_03450 [Puniceibacterium sp. HSS470]RII39708.1 hypothetical protein DL237_06075 [Pseudooceanicola sediminis]|tara:strand:- start:36779 stop:37330 length:552 start_codon:yes stop_codon:yes gene_type:complete